MAEERPLIGRGGELAALAQACSAITAGHGAFVLVTGEAGIGKSRLLRDALEGSSVVRLCGAGRASVSEPYGPVAQALRQGLRETPDLPARLGGLAPYLAPLLPEVGGAAPDAGEATLVEAILRAFAELAANGPVAILLDDLHWADEATLELLPLLAAGLAETPVLLVALARDEVPDDTHRLRRLRAELRRACEPVELRLRPFDRGETARLAAAVTGEPLDESLVQALHERAGGIPFYVEELAESLVLAGRRRAAGGLPLLPETVLDAVLLRSEALSLDARNALEAAAVLGQRIAVDQLPRDAQGDALAEAIAAGFLVESGPGSLAFRHALVRDAVYQSVPWTRRRSLHGRIAAMLETDGAPAAERAAHWLGAGDVARGRRALTEAAVELAAVYAYRDAARLYERALDLDGDAGEVRFELLEQLARCAELAGDLAGSARAWREVVDAHRRRGDVARVAEAQHAQGRVLALRGSTERAVAAWTAAADGFAACGRREDVARSRLAAAGVLQGVGRLRPALVLIESAIEDISADATPVFHSHARSLEGLVLAKLGDVDRALCSVREALAEALTAGDSAAAAAAYRSLAVTHEMDGRLGTAVEAFEFAVDFCNRNGIDDTGAVCSGCLCHVLRQRGEWRRSLEVAQAMLDDPTVDEVNRAVAAAIMSQIHASRGERRPAHRRVLEAAPVVRQHGVIGAEAECSWTLARLDLLEGSEQGALEHCRDMLRRHDESDDQHYSLNALAWTAGVFSAAGEEADLNRVVRTLSEIAGEYGNREALASLSRALAELSSLRGDGACALEHFRQAIELYDDIELPHDRAELLLHAAAAARSAGLDDQAREWLGDARVQARRLGARPLQAAIEAELATLGSTDGTRRGAAGLTRRQLQIIRRVADGRTNREIAAELVVSVRTVDMHVHNALIALGCRSRLDAARRAADLGLLEPV